MMIRFFSWALLYDLCKNLFGAKLRYIQARSNDSTFAFLGTALMKSYYEIDEQHIYLSGFSSGRRTESRRIQQFSRLFKGNLCICDVNLWKKESRAPTYLDEDTQVSAPPLSSRQACCHYRTKRSPACLFSGSKMNFDYAWDDFDYCRLNHSLSNHFPSNHFPSNYCSLKSQNCFPIDRGRHCAVAEHDQVRNLLSRHAPGVC